MVSVHSVQGAILNFSTMRIVSSPRLESQTPAALTAFKVRVGFWLLLVGAGAYIIPWFIGVTVGEINTLDRFALPALSIGCLGSALWLRRAPAAVLGLQTFVLMMQSSYGLGDFVQLALPTIGRSGAGSPGLPWLTVVLTLFFLNSSERTAFRLGLGYVGLHLLASLIYFRSGVTWEQFNVLLSLFLGNSLVLGILWVISQFRNSYQTMYQIAHTDALTGIMNRRCMQDQLEQQLLNGRGFGVLLIDIDHFKRINDSHGHAIGDQVLRELALLLEGQTRSQEIVSRWGGEEFLVLSSALNAEVAEQVAQRLLEVVRGTRLAGLTVTISIGVAWREDSETLESVVARADTALYAAKANGRNRFEFATSKLVFRTQELPAVLLD
jgi:diguanylate cyclase